MKIEVREKLNAHFKKYVHNLEANENSLGYKITTLESEQEKNFFAKLQENDLFQLLNIIPVHYEYGEAVGLIQAMPGTTNTNKFDRLPKLAASRLKYRCQQMNFDSRIRFDKLDNFTQSDLNFVETFESYLDLHLLSGVLMVGLNGTHQSNNSNPETAPLGEDVAKGWLQKIREHAQNHNGQSVLNVGEIGANGTYKTLNKAVKAGIAKIKPIYVDGDLIAICGSDVTPDNAIENNKDGLGGQFITRLQKLIGGCKAVTIPHFPSNAILLTRLDNLSLYVHRNNVRRGWIDGSELDSIYHYFSFNVDFVVENFEACALLENIELAE